jgi:hypothetical protein
MTGPDWRHAMTTDAAYKNALAKRDELRRELEDVEKFLALYQRFSSHGSISTAERASEKPQSGRSKRKQRARLPRRFKSQEVLAVVRDLLVEGGRPLTRGKLAKAIEDRGITLASQDKPTYIGSLMFRFSDQFVNIPGRDTGRVTSTARLLATLPTNHRIRRHQMGPSARRPIKTCWRAPALRPLRTS